MTTATPTTSHPAGAATPDLGGRDRVDAVALALWAVVVAAAVVWGRSLGAGRVLVDWPPLHALWEPGIGPPVLLPVGLATAVIGTRRLQDRVAWRWLLALALVAAFAWLVAANMWRGGGLDRLAAPLGSPQDYQGDLAAFSGPLDTLAHYTERLPLLGTHNRGHPPGPLIAFEVLRALGIVDLRAVAILVCLAGASVVVPVAAVLRRVGGEDRARRLLPLLVLAPYVLWLGVSFDSVFCAAAAWTAFLWLHASRSRRLLQAATGVCFGVMLMLSYGLAPFALVLLSLRRDRRSVCLAACGVAAVLVAAWAAGFAWPAGLAATNVEYQATYHLQGGRPGWYWWLGDLGALAIATGPAVALSAGRAIRGLRLRDPGITPWAPTLAAAAAVAFMVVSGLTKAEVERIWLPYMPWLLLAAPADRRGILSSVQASWTLAISALVLPWW